MRIEGLASTYRVEVCVQRRGRGGSSRGVELLNGSYVVILGPDLVLTVTFLGTEGASFWCYSAVLMGDDPSELDSFDSLCRVP